MPISFQFANQSPMTQPVPTGGAGQALADFTRDQWQTYVSQFVPIENELIDYAMDPNKVGEARDRALQTVGQQFDVAQGTQERRLRGYGIQLRPDEQAAADRNLNLQRSLGEVQAANSATVMTRDRQRSVMGASGAAMPQG